MATVKLSDLPSAKQRESLYKLDDLIYKMSGTGPSNQDYINQFEMECILCLSNEIKALKEEIAELKINVK